MAERRQAKNLPPSPNRRKSTTEGVGETEAQFSGGTAPQHLILPLQACILTHVERRRRGQKRTGDLVRHRHGAASVPRCWQDAALPAGIGSWSLADALG